MTTTPLEVRNGLVDLLRRDLIGPHPDRDADLANEVLDDERPSRWYVAGFIVPAYDGAAPPNTDEEAIAERREDDLLASETLDSPVTGDADEKDSADQPPRDRFLPSSIGLTVVLPEAVKAIGLRVTWGDYKTVPPLPNALVIPDAQEAGGPKPEKPETLHWVRSPGEAQRTLDVTKNSGDIPLPGTAGRTGGALVVRVHQRRLTQTTPSGEKERLRIVTVFLVNRRNRARAPYTDVAYAFQARIELSCPTGFHPRADLSTYGSSDDDLRLADLHYRDVHDYGVGRNTSAGWEEMNDSPVTRVWTDPMPQEEVERVAPSTDIKDVEFGMQALAGLAQDCASALTGVLHGLPQQYAAWCAAQGRLLDGLAPRRRKVAERLIANQDAARARIERGIALLESDDMAREAFAIMNEAMATAARRRESIAQRKPPGDVRPPAWRPFQLAFVLLNLAGLTDKENPEREIVDLLFFPTGGGKTEAYLGLAAYAIALRRLRGGGVLGAGVSVIMRYTLRLLTLDQLSRAAGLVCALELMRTRDAEHRKRLGEWPIEIGLWVGGAASPNRLKPLNANDTNAATRWLARYQSRPNSEKSPVPLKACPWCGTRFKPESFYFTPNRAAPQNLCIKCENAECDFTRDRALPIVVVDEPIYRRLPAFIIATVDKFANLPWVGQSGAFFGHVDRFDPGVGFYGAAEPGRGLLLVNGHHLDAPDLIIQDELHLISGPLGTVAGLYETAIDLLASRQVGERRIRTKIVASTATVRRAQRQIQALFDREETAVFPPPGIDRRNSFFARTVSSSEEPARRYLGIASQGRGPKLLFLRALQTLLSGAAALGQSPTPGAPDPADPYMTVLTYFNALRELGGARRIVEDEIRQHVAAYGENRVRIEPSGHPFKNRDVRMPLELTSRESTDDVALAKERLGGAVLAEDGEINTESVDVALATNMISVGLDILRLGLMVVQGQPKTAAEYIQATSRVGRERDKPGLVVTLLNLHKPRDRTHYEQFRAFHASFYRAVEPTSVTPFAPRALDRALAAVVVAAARHVSPELSASDAVVRLQDHPEIQEKVVAAIAHRAASAGLTDEAIDGVVGRASELFRSWVEVAEEQTATGSGFTYDGSGAQSRLLQRPLDPDSHTLPDAQRLFEAGRSMRDVEHGVLLKAADPNGRPLS
jgi:hypothetical protein